MSTEKSATTGKTKKKSKHSKSKNDKLNAAALVGAAPRPVYFVSPIYMPYVQAPVCYVKSSSSSTKTTCDSKPAENKKDKESQQLETTSDATLRYFPSSPPCLTATNCVALPAYNYLPSYSPYYRANYALRNGQVVPVGVFRTIPQPYVPLTAGWIPYSGVPVAQKCSSVKSKLNPLSEPYQPQKKADAAESTADEGSGVRSRCSTPEASWSTEELPDSVSRSETPACNAGETDTVPPDACLKCGGRISGCHETDSGVGDEGDEVECSCKDLSESFQVNDDPEEVEVPDEEQDPELDIPTLQSLEDGEEFTEEVVKLIEFICERLHPHEWRAVARELGVSDVVIQCVEYDVYESVREQMRYVFSYWARSQSLSGLTQDALKSVEKSFAEIGRHDLVSTLEVTTFSS